MNGKIYFHFVSSFVMGALSGAFLFVTVYAPAYKSELDTPERAVAEGIVIEGQMYGACEELDSCASFRLLKNRTFNYLPYPDAPVEKGKIPTTVSEPLIEAIDEGYLSELQTITESIDCASDAEGLDFSYTITSDEETFALDTCTTALANDQYAQTLFIDAWNFMQNPTTTYPVFLEKGFGEFLIDRFENAGEVE